MIEIDRQHLDFHSGQHEFVLTAKLDGEPAGALSFAVYKGEVYVKMIEALIPRQDVGTALVVALQDFYPEQMINFGGLTEAGAALLDSLEWNFKANDAHVDAAYELEGISTKLAAYSAKADVMENAPLSEKTAFLAECADWNDLHDRAEGLTEILNTTPEVFRFVVGPRPATMSARP